MIPIQVRDLCKNFRGKKGQSVQALNSLSLKIDRGEVFGFLGPNGAGKSTTIKILVGLIRASSGSAELFGTPVNQAKVRSKVGYLPENPSFYDFLTARELLQLVGRSFGMSPAHLKSESERVFDLLDLNHAADRSIRGFSKGMVQRLGLAQTLLHDPDLFILDEPMSGLDPVGRVLVKEIICDLKSRGKTVFFSTHVTADVEAVCDRVGVIVKGSLRAHRSVDEILETGVTGYRVKVKGDLPSGGGFSVIGRQGDVQEYHVSCDLLTDFMELVSTGGATIHLVEPVRKDIEAFFLDIIHRE